MPSSSSSPARRLPAHIWPPVSSSFPTPASSFSPPHTGELVLAHALFARTYLAVGELVLPYTGELFFANDGCMPSALPSACRQLFLLPNIFLRLLGCAHGERLVDGDWLVLARCAQTTRSSSMRVTYGKLARVVPGLPPPRPEPSPVQPSPPRPRARIELRRWSSTPSALHRCSPLLRLSTAWTDDDDGRATAGLARAATNGRG